MRNFYFFRSSVVTSYLLFSFSTVQCWTTVFSSTSRSSALTSSSQLQMGIVDIIKGYINGGDLVAQSGDDLPYGDPLGPLASEDGQTLAIQERVLSVTGEDFDIYYDSENDDEKKTFCQVRGAYLHMPGKDKMRIKDPDTGDVMAVLVRKKKAMFNIYRGNAEERIGSIHKKTGRFFDKFLFRSALDNRRWFGLLPPKPAYTLKGRLLNRKFVMKNTEQEVVAKISKDRLIQFDAYNHYKAEIAPNFDPIFVVACACAIDEQYDEESRQKKTQEEKEVDEEKGEES